MSIRSAETAEIAMSACRECCTPKRGNQNETRQERSRYGADSVCGVNACLQACPDPHARDAMRSKSEWKTGAPENRSG